MRRFVVESESGAGVIVRNDDCTLALEMPRADILRVRILRHDETPVPSWAIVESAQAAQAAPRISQSDDVVTCATDCLIAELALDTGALSVRDINGRPILLDADDAPFHERGAGFTIRKHLAPELAIFGLGDKPGRLNRRGRSFVNWNTDSYAFQEGQDPLYKDIPFFIGHESGRSFGVFLDNTWRTRFDFGSAEEDVLEFGATGGPIDYYVMAGPTAADVLQAYAFLTGTPPLPPKWALGYQQSRYSYKTADEAIGIARRLREERIPADVMWFDLHLLDQNRSFTVDTKAFPDFPTLVQDLHGLGFAAVVITDFQIAQVEEGYAPYRGGYEQDAFVRRQDGSVYVAQSWGGPSVFPDFSHEPSRLFWGGLYSGLVEIGVNGFWNDMNEPALFSDGGTFAKDVVHRIDTFDGIRQGTHAEMHNVYGMLNGRATYDGLKKLRPESRPFVMMRATYAGGHRYAITWTGDNLSTWNHLRLSTPMLLSLGLGGFSFAAVNLGGFVGTPSPELLTRWLQVGAFNPIAINHSDLMTPMQEPWVHGEPHLTRRRAAIEARYRLMPYLYTLAEETSRTGLPMMRPLFVEFPQAASGYPLDLEAGSQFMLGRALLIAPEPFGEMPENYTVILPPGTWYDYWTGIRLDETVPAKLTGNSGTSTTLGADDAQAPRAVTVSPDPDVIAVFARGGTIVPHHDTIQHTGERPQGPLRLDIYAAAECIGTLYDDDGMSIEPAAMLRLHVRANFADGRFRIVIAPREGSFAPWWTEIAITIHGLSTFGGLDDGGNADFDTGRRRLSLIVADRAEETVIEGMGNL